MARHSKRYIEHAKERTPGEYMPLAEAIEKVKATASAKFDESVDLAIKLGIDPRQSSQNVRGTVVLPHGTGRTVRVAVVAEGADADAAREAGADTVGGEDLVKQLDEGWGDFDVLCATPPMMRILGRVGRKLGPRMPNAKAGTVGPDIGQIVSELKAGKIQYRSDARGGVIHCSIGKTSFTAEQIQENFATLLGAVIRAKPDGVKGTYLRRLHLSATMGPSFLVDPADAQELAG